MWDSAEKKLTAEEVNNLLLATGIDRNTISHIAEKCDRLDMLQELLNQAREKLTPEQIDKLLLSTDYRGRTVLLMAAQPDKLVTQTVRELPSYIQQPIGAKQSYYRNY